MDGSNRRKDITCWFSHFLNRTTKRGYWRRVGGWAEWRSFSDYLLVSNSHLSLLCKGEKRVKRPLFFSSLKAFSARSLFFQSHWLKNIFCKIFVYLQRPFLNLNLERGPIHWKRLKLSTVVIAIWNQKFRFGSPSTKMLLSQNVFLTSFSMRGILVQ